ncbi:MAG: hypothetical protein JSS04_02625 [Proteobacteria bacterium]|nr:hypothetical protein [Pseudomonadota bacterium]
MRHVVTALACLLLLGGCVSTPKPFEHDAAGDEAFLPKEDKVEVAVATPANMPDNMARRVAAALAIELQSYNIVAAVQPAQAPLKVASAMSTRDAEFGTGIEIEIEWYLLGKGNGVEGPAISKTVVQARDYAEASDKLVSRIAQQAAPRVATLMGKPPVFEARSPGQVAAGVNNPPADEAPPVQTAATSGTAPNQPAPAPRPQAPPSTPRQTKVMVGSIEGAPSDGNRQLLGGMRRALGSSRIVVMDSGGPDTFVVSAKVKLTPIDDRTGQLDLSWYLKDPGGREIGKVDQSNPVPLAAARGSWAGFGDIVAQAAVEGILELIEQATKKPQ